MASERYVLADPAERLPFRRREFRREGEMMDAEASFTRRLVQDGSIKLDPSVPPLPALPGDLDTMTRDELVALAEARGVTIKSNDTKAEIIAALKGSH